MQCIEKSGLKLNAIPGGGGGGGGIFVLKMEIPGSRRGGLREILSVVGVWIFSGTTHYETVMS